MASLLFVGGPRLRQVAVVADGDPLRPGLHLWGHPGGTAERCDHALGTDAHEENRGEAENQGRTRGEQELDS